MPRAHHRSAFLGLTSLVIISIASRSSAQMRIAPPPSPSPSSTPQAAATVGSPPPQAVKTHWTLEFRGGVGLATNPSTGAGQLAGLGATLVPATATQGPVRAVSSWFFGDGAAQLNSVAASASPMAPALPALDSMLTTRSANRGSGGAFGVTLGRDVSPHLSVEVNVDISSQPFAFTSAAAGALASAPAGFIATWQALLAATHPGAVPEVDGKMTEVIGAGGQVDASGTLTYRLKPGSGFDPFISVGAGILAGYGDTPSSTLHGNYAVSVPLPQFVGVTEPIFSQQDLVTINVADHGSRLVGVLGGGLEKALSAHGGLRFGARLAVGSNRPETTLSATPTTVQAGPGTSSTLFGLVTMISNQATTITFPATLSGPSLTAFKTFTGQGIRIESTITIGYFFRF